MDVVCINSACPENEIPKAAGHLDPPPTLVLCGHCGKPCELREQPAEQ
jgi:hypothetical protein